MLSVHPVGPFESSLPKEYPRGRPLFSKFTSFSSSDASSSHINADSIRSQSFDAHHHLPTTSETNLIPSDPILFLPPLLSPLPSFVSHDHSGPTEQFLSSFETRLPHIDPASLRLHQALHRFRPLSDSYAAQVYDEAFNWSELVSPTLHIARFKLTPAAPGEGHRARMVLRCLPLSPASRFCLGLALQSRS